jgi:hypothetical protein
LVAEGLREDVTLASQHNLEPTSTKWANTIAQVRAVRQYFCSAAGLPSGFREIAGAVAKLEFLFLQVGVGDFDGDLAISAVVLLVR